MSLPLDERAISSRGGTRTHDLLLVRETPLPLGIYPAVTATDPVGPYSVSQTLTVITTRCEVDRRGIEPLTDWLPAILAPMEHVGPHNETKTRIVKETTLRDSNPHLSRSVVRPNQSVFPLHQAPMFALSGGVVFLHAFFISLGNFFP